MGLSECRFYFKMGFGRVRFRVKVRVTIRVIIGVAIWVSIGVVKVRVKTSTRG